MRMLERADKLNRAVEFLPDDETLDECMTAKQGLTRPEIAILMSYSKIWLYDELLASNLPDDPRLWAALQQASGGTWGGCVYDVDEIVKKLSD